MHGAGMGGAFKALLVLVGNVVGHVDFSGEAADPAGGHGGHVFFDDGRRAGHVDAVSAGDDAHGGEDAGAERRSDEVGGGEAFAAALVVPGGVCGEGGGGGLMHGSAVQVSFVVHLDGDHGDPFVLQSGSFAAAHLHRGVQIHHTNT